jgi:hypothetical protein
MRHVCLNEYLCVKSNWPRRLLGWEQYSIDRSESAVTSEYDKDRYSPLLGLSSDRLEDYKIQEFANLGMRQDDTMFISLGEEVFATTVRAARVLWYSTIRSYVERFATGLICELGAGYGYNLSLLGSGYGGEYSPAAVTLGRRLGMDVSPFNYYRQEQYNFIRPGSTILTVHSIEQIPKALCIINNLRAHRDRIRQVINIEPCWLDERSTLMGMIRNRYNQLIDHNHDLVRILRTTPDVRVLHFESDVFGLHPLNSSHVTVWKFAE